MASSHLKDDKAVPPEHISGPARDAHDIISVQGGDLLDLERVDPVLNARMKLVNDTIDEIGFTRYQAKLFVLNGFGYVIRLQPGRRDAQVRLCGRKGLVTSCFTAGCGIRHTRATRFAHATEKRSMSTMRIAHPTDYRTATPSILSSSSSSPSSPLTPDMNSNLRLPMASPSPSTWACLSAPSSGVQVPTCSVESTPSTTRFSSAASLPLSPAHLPTGSFWAFSSQCLPSVLVVTWSLTLPSSWSTCHPNINGSSYSWLPGGVSVNSSLVCSHGQHVREIITFSQSVCVFIDAQHC
jgi:hypothetical protein